ncbi:hypothetical protein FRC12_014282 [Ceratobasidium sp. 428]|nr:hypothetical protein FRC12_014282 [Ceratobasidium sp. 428]
MSETLQCNLHNATVNHDIFLPHQFEGRLEGPDTGGGNADIYREKKLNHKYRVKLNAVNPPRKVGAPGSVSHGSVVDQKILFVQIAIKCFRPRSSEDNLVQTIANELKIWKILNQSNNQNVAPLLGVLTSHEYNGFLGTYIPPSPVCEYYQNRDLDDFLRLHNPNPSRRFQLLTGVVRGLAHVHKLLVVHGDLKASNVLVNDAGTVAKLCDFGSSRIDCACDCGLENQCGTLPWDSPELFEGDVRTTMSDMWAFGCIALEAQFGKVPYNANFLIAYRNMRKNLPPATRESVVSVDFISNAVWETMQRCWEFDPQSRPSAQAVLAEFEELESDDNSQPTITIPQNVVLGID